MAHSSKTKLQLGNHINLKYILYVIFVNAAVEAPFQLSQ